MARLQSLPPVLDTIDKFMKLVNQTSLPLASMWGGEGGGGGLILVWISDTAEA